MKLQELQHQCVSGAGSRRTAAALVFMLLLVASGITCGVVTGQSISLSITYTQNFDTLANSGTSNPWTNGSAPLVGFYAGQQNGTLSTYRADNGGSNSGALYSYGATGGTERALGSVSSGTPGTLYHGARFVNDTGGALVGISIGYTGEQWRCGGNTTPHRIDFQYQIGPAGTIADIKSGTWTDFDALDFTGPVATATAGPLDGNDAANRLVIAPLQLPVNIPDTYEFWIRWVDVNDTGSDHGLAVDDLFVSRYGGGGVSLSVGDVTVPEGNTPATTTATFVVSLSGPAPSGGVTFDIATADGTATTANNDYLPRSLNGVTIPEGSSSYNFDVTVNGDDTQEVTETFTATVTNVVGATVLKDTGTCTITNDDFPVIPIHDVQGNGDVSPFDGVQVTVRGIVYAVTYAGFFIQALPGDYDADPATSEGILVYTGSPVPAEAVIGNQVLVTGTVDEYYPSGDPYRFITELTNNTVLVEATGQPLPTPVTLTAAEISPTGPVNQLERFEGMRVHVDSLTSVSGTFGRWVSEAQSLYASTGNFYCVLTGTPRPFREPGIEDPWPIPVPPCCIPRFDANPERIALDTDVLAGSTAVDVTAGVVIGNVTGPLDYAARTYTIYPEPGYTVGTNVTAQPAPAPLSTDANVAFWNMHHFYNDINDAGGDLQLTTIAYQGRLNKASLAIRNLFHTPDILAVIEMENLATLQDLANKVNADVVAGGGANPGYVPFLFEGNDPSNINVGFMVKSNVTVASCTQIGKDATFIREDTGTVATLHDRPPLVLQASVQPAVGPATPLVVIVYHLRSLGGVDDIVGGVFERQKRMLQAEAIGTLAQSYQANPANLVVVGGDFNAYEFNDGWVDCMGIVRGDQVGADQVYKWSTAGDLVEPNLVELISLLPPDQRYSYTYFGSAQTLDHALVSQNLLPELTYFGETHVNADFPYVYRNDINRPERLSDHDCFQLYVRSPMPRMVTQPVGGAVCTGQTFTLGCTAAGKETLTYTWYWGNPGDTSSPVGTGNPLVFTPLPGSNPYYCRVSNLWGYADSAAVIVTANATTGILNQPLDETICEGWIARLQVGALGAGLTYQWYEGTTPIFGADDYFLEVSPTATTDYWVRVTGDCGTVDSDVATVTVQTGAAIVGATWNQSICAGTRATLSLTVSGTAPAVQWFWSPDGVNYTLVPGATSTTYTTPPLFARTVYMALVDNVCGDDQKIMVVDVVTPPAVTGVTPETMRVNTGRSALLTVFYVASEPVVIQWYEGEAGDVSHPVEGATSAVFHTPQVYADTHYWVRVTNGCGSSDSLAVPVTVWNVYYLPHVVSTSEWWTKVSLVNAGGLNPKAGEAVDDVEVRAYDSAGQLQDEVVLSVPAQTRYEAELEDLLSPGTPVGDLWLKVESKSELKGLVQFGTRDEGAQANLPFMEWPTKRAVFSYVTSVYGWYTGVTLVNAGSGPAAVKLTAYDEDGVKLGEETETVQPLARYVNLVGGIFPPEFDVSAIRSLMVESSEPLVGFELFGNTAEAGVAGLPLTALDEEKPEHFYYGMFYPEVPGDAAWYTGVTFMNLDVEPATVMAEVYDPAGVKLGSELFAVNPKAQMTRELYELFPAAKYGTMGYFLLGAFERITGFELVLSRGTPFRFDGLRAVEQAYARQVFPVVVPGGTHVRLINKSDAPMTLTVKAYGADGLALGTYPVALAKNAKADVDVSAAIPTDGVIAWLLVEGNNLFTAHAFILTPDGKRLVTYAGVPLY